MNAYQRRQQRRHSDNGWVSVVMIAQAMAQAHFEPEENGLVMVHESLDYSYSWTEHKWNVGTRETGDE